MKFENQEAFELALEKADKVLKIFVSSAPRTYIKALNFHRKMIELFYNELMEGEHRDYVFELLVSFVKGGGSDNSAMQFYSHAKENYKIMVNNKELPPLLRGN